MHKAESQVRKWMHDLYNSSSQSRIDSYKLVTMSNRNERPAKHHHVSIAKFAGGKAAFNQKRKEVEEQKRNQKSKTLREYAKLCKAEGIVSDRVNLEYNEKNKKPKGREQEIKVKDTSGAPTRQTNPFKDARDEAIMKEEEKAKAIQLSKEKDNEIKKKNEMREVKRRERMKRTKKGQPKLSTQITSILGKLQKKT